MSESKVRASTVREPPEPGPRTLSMNTENNYKKSTRYGRNPAVFRELFFLFVDVVIQLCPDATARYLFTDALRYPTRATSSSQIPCPLCPPNIGYTYCFVYSDYRRDKLSNDVKFMYVTKQLCLNN